jgi:hypothetical protein
MAESGSASTDAFSRALLLRMQRHKIRWVSGQGGSLVIAITFIVIQRLMGGEDALKATLIAYVLIGGCVFAFQLLREARRLYYHQENVIASLRSTIESNDDEKAQSLKRVRDSHKRRDAHMRMQHEAALEELHRELAKQTDNHDTPDILLELSETRGNATDLYDAIPIVVYNAINVAMNVQIASVESGVWYAGHGSGDVDATPVPILENTRLTFELIPHIQSNARVSVFPKIDSQYLTESMLREAGATLGIWWLLDRISEHKKHVAKSALPSDASQFALGTAEVDAGCEPFELSLRVTYWNAPLTRQWERVETLHYHPVTRRAQISRHSAPVEITTTVAALHEASARLQTKVTALERAAQRYLTSTAHRVIAERLMPLVAEWNAKGRVAQIGVYYMVGDDCAQYAQSFADLFHSVGFQILGDGRATLYDAEYVGIKGDFARGLFVVEYPGAVMKQYGRPPFGEVLCGAMRDSGLTVEQIEHDRASFVLIVGARIN